MTDRKGLVDYWNANSERIHKAYRSNEWSLQDVFMEGAEQADALAQQMVESGAIALADAASKLAQQDGVREPYGWIEPETGNFVDHATKLAMPFDASTYTQDVYTTPPPSPELAVLKALVLDAIPSNWLDPLLSGPTKFADPPYSCHDIEALLRGIRERITAAIAAVEGVGK